MTLDNDLLFWATLYVNPDASGYQSVSSRSGVVYRAQTGKITGKVGMETVHARTSDFREFHAISLFNCQSTAQTAYTRADKFGLLIATKPQQL